jgi:hypothetical protein
MMQQQYYRFTASIFHEKPLLYDFVSSAAFDFNSSDIDNFRNHFKRLLGNLCVVYHASTKAVSDVQMDTTTVGVTVSDVQMDTTMVEVTVSDVQMDMTTVEVNGGEKDYNNNPACHGGVIGDIETKIMSMIPSVVQIKSALKEQFYAVSSRKVDQIIKKWNDYYQEGKVQ